jgi:hypothetical protein
MPTSGYFYTARKMPTSGDINGGTKIVICRRYENSSALGANTKMTVTYTYDAAVPEPTTLGLLAAAGALGLLAARGRRASK